MLIPLDFNSSTPLYIQVYQQLKAKIMEEELQQGQKLPSKRQLAQDNGISQNTVINAYDQLMVEGFIRAEERRGYFVEDIHFQEHSLTYRPPQDIQGSSPEVASPWLYDLTRSTPDASLFPFSVFNKIYNQLFKHKKDQLLIGAGGKGLADLRHALAFYLNHSRGVPCTVDQLVVGPSSQYLLDLFFKLSPSHRLLAMEDPGYDGYRRLLQDHGVAECPIGLDRDGINMADLQAVDADMVFVTPNHQFPTGSIMPLEKRQQLISWAMARSGRLIIEDDYDGEFKYSGLPIPPLIQLDHYDQVLYLASFTRILSPSIRLSYMVLPKHLTQAFNHHFSRLAGSLNTVMQYALADFIQEGHLTNHLNRSRRLYKKKRDFLIQAIRDIDPQAIIYGEEAGLSLLVKPSQPFHPQRLKALAKEEGIKLALLADFCRRKETQDEQTLYMSFSSLPMDQIEDLVIRLKSLMNFSLEK